MPVNRNGFDVEAVTYTFRDDSPVPGAIVRGNFTTPASSSSQPAGSVWIEVWAELDSTNIEAVDEADRAFFGRVNTNRVLNIPPGEDQSLAAIEARFYKLADELVADFPTPATPA